VPKAGESSLIVSFQRLPFCSISFSSPKREEKKDQERLNNHKNNDVG
jgi:hypothetical protein